MNLKQLITKYNLDIKGVIHIGAHYGQEHSTYLDLGINKIVYFEPQRSIYDKLVENVKPFQCINKALGNSVGNVMMNCETANQGMSSSILTPDLHISQYPHIVFDHREDVIISTLDLEVKEHNLIDFNMIAMDVQGYELEVLKGSRNTLWNIEYVYTEVNRASVYRNCVEIDELDEYLREFGFSRVETDWAGNTWGDAFYFKNKELKC